MRPSEDRTCALPTCFLQKSQAPLGFLQRQDEGGLCRVETKPTFIITFAREMIVDTCWSGHFPHSPVLLRPDRGASPVGGA